MFVLIPAAENTLIDARDVLHKDSTISARRGIGSGKTTRIRHLSHLRFRHRLRERFDIQPAPSCLPKQAALGERYITVRRSQFVQCRAKGNNIRL